VGENYLTERFIMIKIILADDHQVVRKGFKALLSVEPDLKIVGEAGDGFETVKLVEQLQPDVLVLDLMMTGINGLEVTRQLTKKNTKLGIVILSMHSNEAYVLEALRSGARAYILKESPPEELVKAIHEVHNGRHYLSSPLTERAIEAYTQTTETQSVDPYDQLTTREREVLHLAAQGLTNNEIAIRLFISSRTVETHRTNFMRKLSLHNHSQLIQFAIQHGLISGQS
jgi:two-component system, NarL family, response regulator NreC